MDFGRVRKARSSTIFRHQPGEGREERNGGHMAKDDDDNENDGGDKRDKKYRPVSHLELAELLKSGGVEVIGGGMTLLGAAAARNFVVQTVLDAVTSNSMFKSATTFTLVAAFLRTVLYTLLAPLIGSTDAQVVAENSADFVNGLSVEQLSRLSRRDAEKRISDQASKTLQSLEKRLKTETYDQAIELLDADDFEELDERLGVLTEEQKKLWEHYKKQLNMPQKLRRLLETTRKLDVATDEYNPVAERVTATFAYLERHYKKPTDVGEVVTSGLQKVVGGIKRAASSMEATLGTADENRREAEKLRRQTKTFLRRRARRS